MFGLLSEPLKFSDNFEENIEIAYDFFQTALSDSQKRPVLFDKEVFVEAHGHIDGRPQGFWHIVSIEDSHHFKVLPCVNDGTIDTCSQNCVNSRRQVAIKFGTEIRNICLLRASRLPWIVDIIKLASQDNPAVAVWLKPGKGKATDKLYLRYNHHGADYVIIFSVEKHFYRLISAFPVFYIKEKEEFSRDCSTYAWSYFNKK